MIASTAAPPIAMPMIAPVERVDELPLVLPPVDELDDATVTDATPVVANSSPLAWNTLAQ